MTTKEKLKSEIWDIMKKSELCYDPELHSSPYDAFDGDGGEYHIMHSIKAVKSPDGTIHIYNASNEYYTLIDTIDGLKVVRAFIQDPSFSFRENLVCEYDRVVNDNKRLIAENAKINSQFAENLYRLAAHREAMHKAEEQAQKTVALIRKLINNEKQTKYQKTIYQLIIDTLKGNKNANAQEEVLQGMWERDIPLG